MELKFKTETKNVQKTTQKGHTTTLIQEEKRSTKFNLTFKIPKFLEFLGLPQI